MEFFGKNVTPAILNDHLWRFSRSLFPYYGRYTPILKQDKPFFIHSNLYVCPMCTEKYVLAMGESLQGNGEFSIDHVPPKSVGGKIEVITCKKCNNDSGHAEAELQAFLDFGEKDKDNTFYPKARIRFPGIGKTFPVDAKITGRDGFFEFKEKAKQFNPQLKELISKMHEGKIEKLQIQYQVPDHKKISFALLKAAYLTCFYYWGYEFVYSDIGNKFREFFNGKLEYPVQAPIIMRPKNEHPLQHEGVGILYFNKQKQCYFANMEIKKGEEVYTATVLVPPPVENAWENLANVKFTYSDDQLVSWDIFPSYLPHRSDAYSGIWASANYHTSVG
ncbi:MAG: hypothetical protein V4557_12790 [Bacteroidota bacterium]